MRTEYVVSAKTVDEAYRKAQEQYSMLGEVELVEVVNPGKKGFLGIFGVVPAEIKISVDDGRPERPERKEKAQKVEDGEVKERKAKAQKPAEEVTEWNESGFGGASIADLLNKNS